MRIFALFNLKPGVDEAAYTEWAKTVDLPTANGLPSIDSFRLFKTTGLLGSDAKPPYSHIEVLDIADMDQFGRDVATEAMQAVAAAFQGMVDVTFITTDEIVA
ncbi:REDY-like protein HapK [Novosphingobium sediminicola]|uniref:REDY-like protein HapK n=1 Tax=Novosphingobium sediminicola TaxID=563162 RepID=A0A7W6CJM3_9SPHN|nr:REDY-like protein HapK [Novosphingobium sediminicola]MBB3954216.1 hypothetical protein [Novosphingobium sediminicola]